MVEDKPNKFVENAESIVVTMTLEPVTVKPMSLDEKKASRKRLKAAAFPTTSARKHSSAANDFPRAKIEEVVEAGMVWLDGSGPHANANELKAKWGAIEEKGTSIQRRYKKAKTRPRALRGMPLPAPVTGNDHPNPQPSPPPTAEMPVSEPTDNDTSAMNQTWASLRVSLQGLGSVSRAFPQLASAASILLDCFDGLEATARNQSDYEDLARELTGLIESLEAHTNTLGSPSMTKCISGITIEIKQQAEEINKLRIRNAAKKFLVAKADEANVLQHYRRIQSLFRQLQANESKYDYMEHDQCTAGGMFNTIKALNPVKQAAYDSALSSTIGRRSCTEGTRVNIMSDLNKWARDSSGPSIFWMNGMAGTGKTTIACTFSQDLEQDKRLAASFFCTRTSAECRDVTRIISTIAYQLARYSAPFQSSLCEVLGDEPDLGSKHVQKQFERLLRDPLLQSADAMPNNLVIVIDALDECDDHAGVELILDLLFRHAQSFPLKIYVTSRPEPEIYNKMALYSRAREVVHLHEIEKSLVQADIELYLQAELTLASPSASDITELVQRSGALFIYAATLVRYINSGKRLADPHKRLKSVLDMAQGITTHHTQIDSLYAAILGSVLNDHELEPDEKDDVQEVLWTVLLAQEPISIETIATLSGINNPKRVILAIQPLRSVLHQSERTGVVSTLHASFPDFMFSNEQSGAYFCDKVKHNHALAERCFLAMQAQLRFNICDLETSFIPDAAVIGIEGRIKGKIPPPLAYACRYWGSHLAPASKSESLLKMLSELISYRLLFWMEVMNLRCEIVMGYETLLKAKQWLNRPGPTSLELVILVEDARNFVTSFASSPVAQSTPHIYISSLPLCPRSSSVYQNYWTRTRGLLELKGSLIERREAAALATWNLGSGVWSIAYSPDGTRVAAGCKDRTVRIMNAHDGTALLDPLHGHTDCVNSVAFSPDGKLIASGSDDHTVQVWNAYTGAPATGLFQAHDGSVTSVAFSPNVKQIVSGSEDSTICLWDAYNSALLRGPFAKHDNAVYSVTFSPDGALIASASHNNTIQLWNTHDGTPTTSPLEGHTDWVRSVVFTPDGNRLVSGSDDRTIRVWNTSDGSLVTSPFQGHTHAVTSVAVSPDGTQVASGSLDRTVRVWNIDDGSLVAGPFVGHTSGIYSVAFSPDGTRVISGSYDQTVRVWNVRDGLLPLPVPFEDHVRFVESVSLPDNNTRILSRSSDSTWAWDITPEGIVPSLLDQEQDTNPPEMQSSETCSLTFTTDHCIEVCSKTDGSLIAGPLRGHTNKIISCEFSADSRYLVTGSWDCTICVWDLNKAELVGVPFRGHASDVTSVALFPDASRVVSCSYDETIRIWNTHCAMIPAPAPPNSLAEQSLHRSPDPILEGWEIREDGWVINSSSAMLFWIPSDLASIHAWPSPHAEFIINKNGILHIVQKELYLGDRWSRCYVSD
ncbi:WD repeat-containing protein 5 homolog [Dictyostelium discoideum] [Rhizoctonia solani]|uniref:WD repeat-containing protein 5 homolog [Dictyostelium discoideum] n=1 Tax=Rhizoctonia solani TaxID=456999 RepID=A0A0K6GGM1_9AGAM|nr:WD repeat-containing protein 5 homolog [Dictyostelium discoideum] [Rhizoctonia solani]